MCGSAQAQELPQPLTHVDFPTYSDQKIKLGQLLFYDKILSGNRNISCGTCHHPKHGTSDGLSLGIGEGGVGLGPARRAGPDGIHKRIPRNAPGLWNLGAFDIDVMFHDGRLVIGDTFENEFDSPAEEWLPVGFNSVLAAQAVFPLVAQFEMSGNPGENDVAGAVHDRIDAAWPILAKRVRGIPEYGAAFVDVFDHIETPEQVSIVDIANALSAFMTAEWASFDTPFDAFLSGDKTALSGQQKAGMDLFYGAANCSACHSGKLMSDQKFHALGLPSFGPGRTRRFSLLARDVGFMAESDRLQDAYRFRTPMLRNVTLTAPYGHNGAYATLKGIINHHLNPQDSLHTWTQDQLVLPKIKNISAGDFLIQQDLREMERQRNAIDITPITLSDKHVDDLIAFMAALTGKKTIKLGVPDHVPSGLSID